MYNKRRSKLLNKALFIILPNLFYLEKKLHFLLVHLVCRASTLKIKLFLSSRLNKTTFIAIMILEKVNYLIPFQVFNIGMYLM